MVAFQLSTANCIYVKCKKTQKKDWSTLLQSRIYRKEATVNHLVDTWCNYSLIASCKYGYNYLPFFEIPPFSFSIHFAVLNLMTSEQPGLEIKYNRVCTKIMKCVSLCSVTVFSTVLFFYKVRQVDDITIINLQTKWHISLNTEHQTNTEHSTFVIF